MKIDKTLKLIIPTLLVIFMAISCDVNDPSEDFLDESINQVEFKPTSQEVNEPEDDPNTVNVNEGASFTVTVNVQLIGRQREQDLQVPFTINSENTSAVEGTHFNILTPSPVTLAANSSVTTVQLQILEADEALNSGETAILELQLQDPDGEVIPAENFKSYRLFINGTDAPPAE